jgi:hypothetical protein
VTHTICQVQRLTRWECIGLFGLLLASIALCYPVVRCNAFGSRRRGDFNVYMRAAWAVRSGSDLRTATCDNGCHYCYPPTLAVLLVPLADPPPSEIDAVVLHYAVSIVLWYLISLALLFLAMHWLAGALEETVLRTASGPEPAGSRRWWSLRVVPALACLSPVAETLMRGQVGTLLLLLLCGFLAELLRGRSLRAGVYLAGAICLKIIPVFLLLVPLWRRDAKCLAGVGLGLLLFGVLIPMPALGLRGTWDDYQKLYDIVLAPALGYGDNSLMADELTSVTGVHSQSFMAVIHSWMHPDRALRPRVIPAWTRGIHWLFGGVLVLITLRAGWSLRGWLWGNQDSPRAARPPATAQALALFAAALMILMVLLSPVCHTHYLLLAIPLAAMLLIGDKRWLETGLPSRGFLAFLAVNIAAGFLPMQEGFKFLWDGGLAGIVVLGLFALGVLRMAGSLNGQRPQDNLAVSGLRGTWQGA